MKLAAAAILLLSGCGPKPDSRPAKTFVVGFEDLTGQPALAWMARGATHQLSSQLRAARAADAATALAGGATRLIHGSVSVAGDRLRVRVEVERELKIVGSAEASGPVAGGVVSLVDAAARGIDAGARPFGTRSEAALAAYLEGIETADPARRQEALERALNADPDFGAPYVTLMQLAVARRDRAGAEGVLSRARARKLDAIEAARVEVEGAAVSGDRGKRSEALDRLARLDPSARPAAGQAALEARRYGAAIEHFTQARAADPGNADLLNLLGYAHCYAGDFDRAIAALGEYEKARPNDPNPLDSLAEVHQHFGRFAEAEKLYREAHRKDPNFLGGAPLLKAAHARALAGDLAGARTIAAEYEKSRRAAKDPLVDYRLAEFDALTGRVAEAVARLERMTTPLSDLAALARGQACLWRLESGDREKAVADARSAAGLAKGPTSAGLAALCGYLAGAGRAPSREAEAYRHLLERRFAEAAPILATLHRESAPNVADLTPVFLAWALAETGRGAEAKTLVARYPVLTFTSPAPLASLAFSRLAQFNARAAAFR
ncbi:MAG: tetratricopeptide repeat protein [Bryobacteraceae bacterium]